MIGFGGGLTWGASVVEWGVPMPYKPRGWWYRSMRWMVYRWAKVRSWAIRRSRQLESMLPLRNGEADLLPDKPLKEKNEVSTTHTTSGNGANPDDVELPATKPAKKTDRAKAEILEAEEMRNGKS